MKANNKSFTLIEVLVAVAIFTVVFMITMAFVNLAAGRAKSNRTKYLTNELRNTMEIISHAFEDANNYGDIAPLDRNFTYGFKTWESGTPPAAMFATASKKSGNLICTFFMRKENQNIGRIYQLTNKCEGTLPRVDNNDWQPLTSEKINITNFSFRPTGVTAYKSELPSDLVLGSIDDYQSPYVRIIINAQDTDPKYAQENQMTLQTSFSFDYQTFKKLVCQGVDVRNVDLSDPGTYDENICVLMFVKL